MQLFAVTILALIAFAANSILNRAALSLETIGPAAFMAIRLFSGAFMLLFLVMTSRNRALLAHMNLLSASMLLLYMAGFSFAYLSLETGIGALILFGGVQVTMFAGALFTGDRPGLFRWVGAVLGMLGLAVLFWPGASAPPWGGAFMMLAAAIGWGGYSLLGRRPGPALAKTAANFLLAAPVGALIWLAVGDDVAPSQEGILLAVASGAIASGMGYALWYLVLPRLDASLAAIAQLTVPIIALAGGAVFLSEPLSWRFALAAIMIGAAVLIATRPMQD